MNGSGLYIWFFGVVVSWCLLLDLGFVNNIINVRANIFLFVGFLDYGMNLLLNL